MTAPTGPRVEPVQTWERLQSILNSIPSPKRGMKRVFRGESDRYATMSPHGFRYPQNETLRRDWVMRALRILPDTHPALRSLDPVDIWTRYEFWISAILQHYGPGSKFLDATSSLEVATWFAMNEASKGSFIEAEFTREKAAEGSALPVSLPAQFYSWKHAWPAWLHVLDVVPARDGEPLFHGAWIDLTLAPPEIGRSRRIECQQAGLIYASDEVNQGDLMGFVVASIPIGPLYLDHWELRFANEMLFPDPMDDPWYQALLRTPLAPRIADSPTGWRMGYPIQIPIYLGSDPQASMDSVFELARPVIPPLVFAYLATHDRTKLETRHSEGKSVRLAEATIVLCEGQIVHLSPHPEDPAWNDCALFEQARSALSDAASRSIGLHNVFLEFSVLEHDWDAPLDPLDEGRLRALWLCCEPPHFLVFSFQQRAGVIRELGPFEIDYRENEKSFVFTPTPSASPRKIAADPYLGSPFFVALMLIADVVGQSRVSPYARHIDGDDTDGARLVRVSSRPSCSLVQCPSTRWHQHVYSVARSANGVDPYLGSFSEPAEGEAEVRLPSAPFQRLSWNDITEVIRSANEPPSPRGTRG